MGTIGASGLRRSSLSRKRSQRSIETIEAYLGRTIGGDTSDHSTSQKTSSERRLENNTRRSLDKTNKW